MLIACSERFGFSESTINADQEGSSEVRSSTTCWLNPLKVADQGGEAACHTAAEAVLARIDAQVAAFCQVRQSSQPISQRLSPSCFINLNASGAVPLAQVPEDHLESLQVVR